MTAARGYPGGKGGAGVYQAIINQMPPHEVYIEPFLGAGSVLRFKRSAAENIAIDRDPSVIAAFGVGLAAPPELTVLQADAIGFLEARQWTGRELVYCDPPYVMSARRYDKAIYAHEMSDSDHERLLAILKRLPCLVMISGYPSPLYAAELSTWRLVMFTAATRGRPALEYLWCNFPEPKTLHDPRYLGDDYRERERIKRKAARWQARFAALDPLERQAVLSVCFGEGAGDRPSPKPAMSADTAGSIATSGDTGSGRSPASPEMARGSIGAGDPRRI